MSKKDDIEMVANSIFEGVEYLMDMGVVKPESKTIFSAEFGDEGVVVLIIRTGRVLSTEEIEEAFNLEAGSGIDFTTDEPEAPGLTLVVNNETKH